MFSALGLGWGTHRGALHNAPLGRGTCGMRLYQNLSCSSFVFKISHGRLCLGASGTFAIDEARSYDSAGQVHTSTSPASCTFGSNATPLSRKASRRFLFLQLAYIAILCFGVGNKNQCTCFFCPYLSEGCSVYQTKSGVFCKVTHFSDFVAERILTDAELHELNLHLQESHISP